MGTTQGEVPEEVQGRLGALSRPFQIRKASEKKMAIVGFGKPKTEPDFGADIQVKSIPEFMREIVERLREIDPKEENLPERFPLLRAIQFALFYGGEE